MDRPAIPTAQARQTRRGINGQPDNSPSACAGLTNLTIPGTLANIGDNAFAHCTGLISVTLADGVSRLGTNAFNYCWNLESITLPETVTSIGDLAFWSSGLTNVTIPGSVTNLGFAVFAVCSSLANVTIEEGVPAIGETEFNFCGNLSSLHVSFQPRLAAGANESPHNRLGRFRRSAMDELSGPVLSPPVGALIFIFPTREVDERGFASPRFHGR